MLKGKKRERSRTFVEIVFFAAGWVTGVHDDGDVLIFGEVEEGEKGNESESEIRKKKGLGASDNGKEKKSIVIPCRNLDELVQKLCWFHQPRTATNSHILGKWENAMAQFDTSLRPSHVQVIALSFSFLNNNTTTNNTTTTTSTNNTVTMADALEEAGETGGGASLAKDLFSGAVGGIAQVLIGKM